MLTVGDTIPNLILPVQQGIAALPNGAWEYWQHR